MGPRARKAIGVAATIGFLTVYCLVAMAVGAAWVVGASRWLEAAYFIAAGLAWLPAVMVIIRWMTRPPQPE
jgi:hypothetical protein